MGTPAAAVISSTSASNPAFWERLWRVSGINFVVFFVVAIVLYGHQPQVGASADTLGAFYEAGRTRILIAAVVSGMAVLNLLWFAAAVRTTLAAAGQDGWGAAATAASAVLGGLMLLLIAVGTALAYSTDTSGSHLLMSGLNDLAWSGFVMSSFPRAMLIMAGTLGLWRAGLISNALFGAGVAVLVLVLLGGTTWASDGFWAPDGPYSRLVSPIIGLIWVVAVSGFLVTRSPTPAARAGW